MTTKEELKNKLNELRKTNDNQREQLASLYNKMEEKLEELKNDNN